jgi:hypothetical protein
MNTDIMWGGASYPDYQGHAHHSHSGEDQAHSIAAQDQADKERIQGQVTDETKQFEGDPGQSPIYQSLKATGIDSTSDAYRSAKSNTRAAARAAGFGYEQPVTEGMEGQLEAAEASDLAKVPTAAKIESANMGLRAAGLDAGLVAPNASGAVGANRTLTDAQSQEYATNMGLVGNLAKIGTSFIPVPK